MGKQKAVSLKPSDIKLSLGDYAKQLSDNGIWPQEASRGKRDSLRVGHGDTLAVLPTAIQSIKDYYSLPSIAATTQYATSQALDVMNNNQIVIDCIAAYDAGLARAKKSTFYRDIRDRGTAYSIDPKAERSMSIWAFSDGVADGLDSASAKLGLVTGHAVQIFLCLSLLFSSDALEPEQVTELMSQAQRGLIRIALYKHTLEFDEKCVVM